MDVRISVESLHPLVGSLAHDGLDPRPFVGWLGLLGQLSEVFERTPVGGRGELGARGHAQLGEHPGDVVADGTA